MPIWSFCNCVRTWFLFHMYATRGYPLYVVPTPFSTSPGRQDRSTVFILIKLCIRLFNSLSVVMVKALWNLPMFMMLLLREVDMGKSFHNAVAISKVSAADGNHEPFILAQDVYSDGVMVYQLLFMTLSKKWWMQQKRSMQLTKNDINREWVLKSLFRRWFNLLLIFRFLDPYYWISNRKNLLNLDWSCWLAPWNSLQWHWQRAANAFFISVDCSRFITAFALWAFSLHGYRPIGAGRPATLSYSTLNLPGRGSEATLSAEKENPWRVRHD